ncbi:MAG: murein L,D-transpeptidase catalytic domain family protein [Bdellovibrionota bacterium]|nr:MAG: murein L,D-transpeptidase catalytic domain family protein [Bdellovibrionota bacterium]
MRPLAAACIKALLTLGGYCAATAPLATSASADEYAHRLIALAPSLNYQVAALALKSIRCAQDTLEQGSPEVLGVIDYSLPSTQKRFWLFDLKRPRLLLEDWVAHGKNSGENEARLFSNAIGSLQSSLGLFRVGQPYRGKHGESLRLLGLDRGFNDRAIDRAIVLHSASYVSPEFIRAHQRLGRSFGCPVVSPHIIDQVVDAFKGNDGFLFSFYPNREWLEHSPLLTQCD